MIVKLMDCCELADYKVQIWKGEAFDVVVLKSGEVLSTITTKNYTSAQSLFQQKSLDLEMLELKTKHNLGKTYCFGNWRVQFERKCKKYEVTTFYQDELKRSILADSSTDANKYFCKVIASIRDDNFKSNIRPQG